MTTKVVHPEAANGYRFDRDELACLLMLAQATGVAGLDLAALIPADPTGREAVFRVGQETLKRHGWLVPADRPHSFHLDESLASAILMLVEPGFVIRSTLTGMSAAGLLHFLSPDAIVEVSQDADDAFLIGVVPDRQTLSARIAALFDSHLATSGQLIVARAEREQLLVARRATIERVGGEWQLSYRRQANDASSVAYPFCVANIDTAITAFLADLSPAIIGAGKT